MRFLLRENRVCRVAVSPRKFLKECRLFGGRGGRRQSHTGVLDYLKAGRRRASGAMTDREQSLIEVAEAANDQATAASHLPQEAALRLYWRKPTLVRCSIMRSLSLHHAASLTLSRDQRQLAARYFSRV